MAALLRCFIDLMVALLALIQFSNSPLRLLPAFFLHAELEKRLG
jgi:hypothetical protein